MINLNLNIKIFKELTTCKCSNPTENLLEGAYYHNNAFIFIDIIKDIRKLKVDMSIHSGFKGKTNFEKCNKFKSCIISCKNKKDIEKIERYLDSQNELVNYQIKKDLIKIQLRD